SSAIHGILNNIVERYFPEYAKGVMGTTDDTADYIANLGFSPATVEHLTRMVEEGTLTREDVARFSEFLQEPGSLFRSSEYLQQPGSLFQDRGAMRLETIPLPRIEIDRTPITQMPNMSFSQVMQELMTGNLGTPRGPPPPTLITASRRDIRKVSGALEDDAIVRYLGKRAFDRAVREGEIDDAQMSERDAEERIMLLGRKTLRNFAEALDDERLREVLSPILDEKSRPLLDRKGNLLYALSEGTRQAVVLRTLQRCNEEAIRATTPEEIADEIVSRFLPSLGEGRYGIFDTVGTEVEVWRKFKRGYPQEHKDTVLAIYQGLLGMDTGRDGVVEFAFYPSRTWKAHVEILNSMQALGFLNPQTQLESHSGLWNSLHISCVYTKNMQKLSGTEIFAKYIAFTQMLLCVSRQRIVSFTRKGWNPALWRKGGTGEVREPTGEKPKLSVDGDEGEKERLEYRPGDVDGNTAAAAREQGELVRSDYAKALQLVQILHGLMLQTIAVAVVLAREKRPQLTRFEAKLVRIFDDFISVFEEEERGLCAQNGNVRSLMGHGWFRRSDRNFGSRLLALRADKNVVDRVASALDKALNEVESLLDQPELLEEYADEEEIAQLRELRVIKMLGIGELPPIFIDRLSDDLRERSIANISSVNLLLARSNIMQQAEVAAPISAEIATLNRLQEIQFTRYYFPEVRDLIGESRIIARAIPDFSETYKRFRIPEIHFEPLAPMIIPQLRFFTFNIVRFFAKRNPFGLIGMLFIGASALRAVFLDGLTETALSTFFGSSLIFIGLALILCAKAYRLYLAGVRNGQRADRRYSASTPSELADRAGEHIRGTGTNPVRDAWSDEGTDHPSVEVVEEIIETDELEEIERFGQTLEDFLRGHSNAGRLSGDIDDYLDSFRRRGYLHVVIESDDPDIPLYNILFIQGPGRRYVNNALYESWDNKLFIAENAARANDLGFGLVMAHEKGKRNFLNFFSGPGRFRGILRRIFLNAATAEVVGGFFELLFLMRYFGRFIPTIMNPMTVLTASLSIAYQAIAIVNIILVLIAPELQPLIDSIASFIAGIYSRVSSWIAAASSRIGRRRELISDIVWVFFYAVPFWAPLAFYIAIGEADLRKLEQKQATSVEVVIEPEAEAQLQEPEVVEPTDTAPAEETPTTEEPSKGVLMPSLLLVNGLIYLINSILGLFNWFFGTDLTLTATQAQKEDIAVPMLEEGIMLGMVSLLGWGIIPYIGIRIAFVVAHLIQDRITRKDRTAYQSMLFPTLISAGATIAFLVFGATPLAFVISSIIHSVLNNIVTGYFPQYGKGVLGDEGELSEEKQEKQDAEPGATEAAAEGVAEGKVEVVDITDEVMALLEARLGGGSEAWQQLKDRIESKDAPIEFVRGRPEESEATRKDEDIIGNPVIMCLELSGTKGNITGTGPATVFINQNLETCYVPILHELTEHEVMTQLFQKLRLDVEGFRTLRKNGYTDVLTNILFSQRCGKWRISKGRIIRERAGQYPLNPNEVAQLAYDLSVELRSCINRENRTKVGPILRNQNKELATEYSHYFDAVFNLLINPVMADVLVSVSKRYKRNQWPTGGLNQYEQEFLVLLQQEFLDAVEHIGEGQLQLLTAQQIRSAVDNNWTPPRKSKKEKRAADLNRQRYERHPHILTSELAGHQGLHWFSTLVITEIFSRRPLGIRLPPRIACAIAEELRNRAAERRETLRKRAQRKAETPAPQPDDLGAQDLSDGVYLGRLKARLQKLLRGLPGIPEVPADASDREVVEICIDYLAGIGLIIETTDIHGNRIRIINEEAVQALGPRHIARRLIDIMRRRVITGDAQTGCKAINFKQEDGKWCIVGFQEELGTGDPASGMNDDQKANLEHEQKEIAFRQRGFLPKEAHEKVERGEDPFEGEVEVVEVAQAVRDAQDAELGAAEGEISIDELLSEGAPLDLEEVIKRFEGRGRELDEWSGRSIAVPIGNGKVLVCKLQRIYEVSFEEEAADMLLARRLFNDESLPMPIRGRDGFTQRIPRGLTVPKEVIGPERISPRLECLFYVAGEGYVKDITSRLPRTLSYERRLNIIKEAGLKTIGQLADITDEGLVYDSLCPLSHGFGQAWVCYHTPLGDIRNFEEQLKNTNVRQTGLGDPKHLRVPDYDYMPHKMAQNLFEWTLIMAYAGVRNGLTLKDISEQIIIPGLKSYYSRLKKEELEEDIFLIIHNFIFNTFFKKEEGAVSSILKAVDMEEFIALILSITEKINTQERLKEISPQITTYGTPGSGTGQFDAPFNTTPPDSEGYFFVVDTDNNRIVRLKLEEDGSYTWISTYGTPGDGTGQFISPSAATPPDSEGYFFVLDRGNNRIVRLRLEKNGSYTWISTYGTPGDGTGQFVWPSAMTPPDSEGYFFVVDAGNDRIVRLRLEKNESYTWISTYGTGQFSRPSAMTPPDSEGYFFVVDKDNNRIVRLRLEEDRSYRWISTYGTIGMGTGQFSWPSAMTPPDSEGYFFVVDAGNDRIVRLRLEEDGSYRWISTYGTPGDGTGQLKVPFNITLPNSEEYFFVAEIGNNRIKRYSRPARLSAYGIALLEIIQYTTMSKKRTPLISPPTDLVKPKEGIVKPEEKRLVVVGADAIPQTEEDLGANDLSHGVYLGRFRRHMINFLRRNREMPDIPKDAPDRVVMELCINYLVESGLIIETTDEHGNIIRIIDEEALKRLPEGHIALRLIGIIRRQIVTRERGVKAINFRAEDGTHWCIVGFQQELGTGDPDAGMNEDQEANLRHEQKEIAFRQRGFLPKEAHEKVERDEDPFEGEVEVVEVAQAVRDAQDAELGAAEGVFEVPDSSDYSGYHVIYTCYAPGGWIQIKVHSNNRPANMFEQFGIFEGGLRGYYLNPIALEARYPGILGALLQSLSEGVAGASDQAERAEFEGALELVRGVSDEYNRHKTAYENIADEADISLLEGLTEPGTERWYAAVYYFITRVDEIYRRTFMISDFEHMAEAVVITVYGKPCARLSFNPDIRGRVLKRLEGRQMQIRGQMPMPTRPEPAELTLRVAGRYVDLEGDMSRPRIDHLMEAAGVEFPDVTAICELYGYSRDDDTSAIGWGEIGSNIRQSLETPADTKAQRQARIASALGELRELIHLIEGIDDRTGGRLRGRALRNVIVIGVLERASLGGETFLSGIVNVLRRINSVENPRPLVDLLRQAEEIENVELGVDDVRAMASELNNRLNVMIQAAEQGLEGPPPADMGGNFVPMLESGASVDEKFFGGAMASLDAARRDWEDATKGWKYKTAWPGYIGDLILCALREEASDRHMFRSFMEYLAREDRELFDAVRAAIREELKESAEKLDVVNGVLDAVERTVAQESREPAAPEVVQSAKEEAAETGPAEVRAESEIGGLLRRLAVVFSRSSLYSYDRTLALQRVLTEAGIEARVLEIRDEKGKLHYFVEAGGLAVDASPSDNFRILPGVRLRIAETTRVIVAGRDSAEYRSYYKGGRPVIIEEANQASAHRHFLTEAAQPRAGDYTAIIDRLRALTGFQPIDKTPKIAPTDASGAAPEEKTAQPAGDVALPEELPVLTEERAEGYLSRKTGVYHTIIGEQGLDIANGELESRAGVESRGGILGGINGRNGFGTMAKYVIIVGGERVIPSKVAIGEGRAQRKDFDRAVENVGELFDSAGHRQLIVHTVANIEELNDLLVSIPAIRQDNAFIYFDTSETSEVSREDVKTFMDERKAGEKPVYMSANLVGVPEEGGYVPVGGLEALAVTAIGLANGQTVDMKYIYQLLAALKFDNPELQKIYAKELEEEWTNNGWAEDPVENLFLLGLLEIPVQPLNVKADLGKRYRQEAREANLSRAL
ncbi:MAG: NHL repeat-containing protein, partial [Candidatus Omnitrophica bacterium]|nr:NHL repeat-containing protein [Candidatus Omnitrophota bacterium]